MKKYMFHAGFVQGVPLVKKGNYSKNIPLDGELFKNNEKDYISIHFCRVMYQHYKNSRERLS
jgi:hypothetical protein